MTHEELQALIDKSNQASNKGNFDEAEILATEVLTELDKPTNTSERSISSELLRGNALLRLADTAYRCGKYDTALEQAHQVLAHAEEYTLPALHPKAHNLIGSVFYHLGNYDKSLEYYLQALSTLESLGDKSGVASVTGNIGIAYHHLGNNAKSLEYYLQALSAHEALGDISGIAGVTGSIGNVYTTLGDYNIALEHFAKALESHEELGEKSAIARVTGNIAGVYHSLGFYDQALENFIKALEAHEELGEKSAIARILGNIGVIYNSLDSYDKALEYYAKALPLAEVLGLKYFAAVVTVNIGLLYSSLRNSDNAMEHYAKALAVFEEFGSKSQVAHVTGNIGSEYLRLGNYEKALEYYAEALAIHEELGEKSGVAMLTGNIGSVYVELRIYDKALEYYIRALALHEELREKSFIAGTIGNIGSVYATQKFEGYNAEQAEEYLLEAIAMSEEIGSRGKQFEFHKSLSALYKIEKRWEECQTHFERYHELEKEVQSEEAKKQAAIMEQQKQAAEREKQLEIERTRARDRENILNNILPEEITQRLIKGENPIADHFESVSILFMDLVNFTKLSSTISAQQLVYLLNAIFTAADGVMREFGMEKIKTIGDAYMAVAGAPTIQVDHAYRAAHAALKLLDVMQNLVVTFPEDYGDRTWIESIPEITVRIGMHCGPVAAGVVGENKFLYDMWGDAVNTASRMESHGEAGRIHVSEEFVQHLTQTLSKGEFLQDEAPSLLGKVGMGLIERGEN